jgi:TatD DNase family protein
MKIIDTHCHPQMRQYDQDREEIIKKALNESVGMICVGTDLATSKDAIQLAEQYEGIWASVGLHPNDNLNEKYDQRQYFKLAQHPKVVAIGEVGLDYYRTTDTDKKKFQKNRFEEQIELATELNKPLIIHCRNSPTALTPDTHNVSDVHDAHKDMIEILKNKNKNKNKSMNIEGVIHSFTGTLEDAKQYIELGFYIGFNGIITFTNQYNDIVQELSVDNIVLETDAPYLTPAPHRGKRNEPTYILYIADKVAELKNIPKETLLAKISNNVNKLFKLK